MPVKLSETPSLYQPTGPREQLEADLERFSDPVEYDQDDPVLVARKAAIRAMLEPASESAEDQMMGYLRSLLEDEDEVQEALSRGRRPPPTR